jgi:hypothetical protein
LVVVIALALVAAGGGPASAAEVRLGDDSVLDAGSGPPTRQRPVLFVHGHNAEDSMDADFNYRKNWIDAVDGLPSFKQTLDATENLGPLDIEPYFIRFVDQDRSIVEDARDIGDAVERILARHDPSHVPFTATPTTAVKVAIVAFSKGTISSRLYLKSLAVQQFDLPAPRLPFNPISEFVALSPPNHGIAADPLFTLGSLAVRQLNNGYRPDCQPFFVSAESLNFIADLNGHPIEDSVAPAAGSFTSEAPSSRPHGDPAMPGTLYLTLYANMNRDAVGGGTASSDCQGRLMARNMSPNVRNVEVSEIPDLPAVTTGLGTAQGPLSVHRNTPHTPAVICLALTTIVHGSAPPDDFRCTSVGTGTIPRIPPRAAVAQVLDLSGSMLDLACTTCPPKLDVMKEAAEIFVQLWAVLAGPGDRIGHMFFGSQITSFPTVSQTLLELSPTNVTALLDDLRPRGTVATNQTAMGGGIQTGIEALEGADATGVPQRHIILFTDGMQNVNPMVVTAGVNLEIANQIGRPASNVTPSQPPRRLNQALGVRIHTVGIGAAPPFVALLTDIAQRTGGGTWITTAPDADLRQFFVESVIAALQGNSPQLVAYRRGSLRTGSLERFRIERGASRAVFKLSWKRGQKLDFRVERDGIDVTGLGRFTDGPFYRIFTIDRPAGGLWTMRLSGRRSAAYEAAAIVDGRAVHVSVTLPRRIVTAGDPFEIRVKTLVRGQPIARSSRVTMTVFRPGESATAKAPRVVTLTHRGDGVFGGVFRETKATGPYRLVVTIDGRDVQIGEFQRSTSASAVVGARGRSPLRRAAAR